MNLEKRVITVKQLQGEKTAPTGLEVIDIPAYTNGYYAIHKQLNRVECFTVTHLQTGHALKQNFTTAKEAMTFGEYLMKNLGKNWSGWKRTKGIDFTTQELKQLCNLIHPGRVSVELDPVMRKLESN